MKNFLSTDDDYELWMLLAHTRYAILKARKKELHRCYISASQAGVLFIIETMGDNATVGQIARWTMRGPHSVSGILNRMKKQGMVRKVSDLHRKNPAGVVLTEKGREAYYQAAKRESIHKIISSLSQEERQPQFWWHHRTVSRANLSLPASMKSLSQASHKNRVLFVKI